LSLNRDISMTSSHVSSLGAVKFFRLFLSFDQLWTGVPYKGGGN